MRYKLIPIVILPLLLILPSILYGHGVRGTVERGGIAVKASYDPGEAMSYAKVKILAPGAKNLFQSGRTDRNGRFSFVPDRAGPWKVLVDDEMGHRLEMTVSVDEDFDSGTAKDGKDPTGPSFTRWQRPLMGLCLIFGLSGILFWWKGKRIQKAIREKALARHSP